MRRIRFVVAGIVIAVMLPPAASGAQPAIELPDAWRPDRPPMQRLAEARGTKITRAAFDRLRGDLIRSDTTAALVLSDPEFVFPSRAGDLDGDGKNDVLVTEFAGESSALSAVRGVDGTQLWGVPGAFAAISDDLDGDGASEVLIQTEERERPANGPAILSQRVHLLDGSGTTRWTYDVPGVVVRAADPKSGGVASDVEFVIGLRVIPDATGDGVDDVWVSTATFGYLDSEVFVVADLISARTLDGASGLPVGHVTTSVVNGLAWAIPAGDVSGDGLADLFVLTGIDQNRGLLSARSVAGLLHWVQEVNTSFAYPTVADLTGDGIPDLMLQAFTDEGAQRLGFDGRDGTQRWAHPDIGYTDVAGDIDGDGGADIIQVESPTTGIRATAWSGADGAILWGPTAYPAPDGAWVLNCVCTDDLTGDGVWDPLTAEVVFADPVTITIRTLDGASGLPLWVVAADPSVSFPVPIGADIDGDGGTDLGTLASNGVEVTARTLRGADHTPAWSVTVPMEGFGLGFYADDVAGGGAHELVLASIRFVDESIRGSAHAIAPGGIIWSIG